MNRFANTGPSIEDIHPIIIEGRGHTAISNVEAFSGGNGALTTLGKSRDFLWVRGDQKLTVTLTGCRMRNYTAPSPLTLDNPKAVIRAYGCLDGEDQPWDYPAAQ